MRSRWTEWAAFTLAVLLIATAYFYRLGGTPLWGDEAGTGLFARNVLHFGYPTGFDGRNLSIYDGGAELNKDLVVAKIPWIQFYLGALSMRIFGDDAGGLRTLFAFLGFLTLFPLRAVLRSRVPAPLFVATLILLTPQVALFHRNARYYSTLTLGFAVLVWIVCSEGLTKRQRLYLTSACMVVLFHAHPVAALACSATLLLHAALRKSQLSTYLISSAVGFSCWAVWAALLGPTLVAPQLFIDFQGPLSLAWFWVFARNLSAAFADMDAVQGLPILAFAVALALALNRIPNQLVGFVKDPLVSLVMLTMVVHTVAVAIAFGTETSEEHSLLRYMPHLIAFGGVPLYILIAKLVKDVRLFGVFCVAVAATNLVSISFWSNRADKEIPISWWAQTYQEFFYPQPEAIDSILEVLRKKTLVGHDDMETLLVIPPWLQEVAIFYLGDNFIVLPQIEPGSMAEKTVRLKIGQEALSKLSVPPQWVLDEAPQSPTSVLGYERIQIPVHRLRPDDGTRPELTRHTFYQQQSVGFVALFRRTK